jgi:hypothetical protein
MFRIGRDNMIINHNPQEVTGKDTVLLVYGEVDCRCHIQRQIDAGREEDDVICELITNYFRTIRNNIHPQAKVVIVSIIPPTKQNELESLHGPITHAFPFVGTDEARSRYTKNELFVRTKRQTNRILFFQPVCTLHKTRWNSLF